ncbi:hypothetical protein [Arenivirga flava]|uniref:Uncharacterized protein n=1 Tax=Arenivirga flava TaxID=1930060 RepID=A0AA37UFD8_9MICO|nr:hypothetical protein [Arenivirga flava]GMA27949.1 hypothetical protein GCM10025874_12020 [Arenivirga flava]
MTAVRSGAEAAILLRERRVPGLALLLDADRLAQAVGEPARIERMRWKPGAGVVASLRTERGGSRFLAAYADAAKAAKDLQTASRLGARLTAVGDVPGTVVGALDGDRAIARSLARLRRRLPGVDTGSLVLRHNPARRIVLRLADGRVLKLAARGRDRVLVAIVGGDLAAAGVPVVAEAAVPRVAEATVLPWWGRGDLSARPDPTAARLAGLATAALHDASPPAGAILLAERSLRRELVRARDGVAAVLPGLAPEAGAVVDAVLRGVERSATPPTVAHGDLSPIRCCSAMTGCASSTSTASASPAPPPTSARSAPQPCSRVPSRSPTRCSTATPSSARLRANGSCACTRPPPC